MIFNLFRKESELEKAANLLYEAIVAQARQPVLFTDYSVEDSISGRFEMVALHAYMLLHRLKDENEAARQLGQEVFNRFFRDMDDSLREIGVGDLSVPKKIKKMAQSFYGRIEAYDVARAAGKEALIAAVSRNVYPDQADIHAAAPGLAAYMLDCDEVLAEQSVEDFTKGNINFATIKPVSK